MHMPLQVSNAQVSNAKQQSSLLLLIKFPRAAATQLHPGVLTLLT